MSRPERNEDPEGVYYPVPLVIGPREWLAKKVPDDAASFIDLRLGG